MENFIYVKKRAYNYSEELLSFLGTHWQDSTIGQGKQHDARKSQQIILSKVKFNSSMVSQRIRYKQLTQLLHDSFYTALKQYNEPYRKYLEVAKGEPFIALKYNEGDYYACHSDGDTGNFNRRVSGLIYLNDNYRGGEIHFPYQNVTIRPETGMLVLFPANFCFVHESKKILAGTKYAVVTWFK